MKVNIGPYPDSAEPREISIEVENFDVWGLDHTLALIIVPALKLLKEKKHGSPNVDDADVPEELRSTSAPEKENEWDTDDNWHKRWDWVMDEMIWAFEQIVDNDNDSQFHEGNIDFVHTPIEWDENGEPSLYRMDKGPEDTHVFHKEAYTAHHERISRGTTLFGKYYRGLWD